MSGIFETMRAYNKSIVYFDEHLQRISRASKLIRIKIPYSLPKLKNIIREKIKKARSRDLYIRLTLSKAKSGAKVSLEVKKYQPFSAKKYREGFAVMVSSFWKDERHPLARIKTTERLLYELSFQEAKSKGFDEAILLNSRGLIAEGTRANIFFVKDKILFIPSLKCGCLDGITKMAVLDLARINKIKTKQGNFTAHDLFDADEAFLTNSLIGVMPLRRVNKIKIGKGQNNKITQFLGKKYSELLHGNKKD